MGKIIEKKAASGYAMPAIGFGTWGMGGLVINREDNYDQTQDISALKYAIDAGIKHYDTAEIYAGGMSEEILGKAIKEYKRSELDIATKVSPKNQTEDGMMTSCQNSLNRLGLDYVDLYYLHMPSKDIPLKETAKGFKRLKQEGLIKYYGVCNFGTETLMRLQDLLDEPISVNQVHYSLVFREVEVSDLLKHCQSVGTIIAAWRPIMWNYKGRENQPPASAWQRGYYPILDDMADKHGKTNVQIALNWLVAQDNVTALVKSSTPKNIDEMMGSLDCALSSDDIENLRQNFPVTRDVSDAVPLS